MTTITALREDAQFFHRLQYPGRRPSWSTKARVWMGSRGLFVLAVHRCTYLLENWRPARSGGRALRPLLDGGLYAARYLTAVLAKCQLLKTIDFEGGVYVSNRGNVTLGARSVGRGTVIHSEVTIGKRLTDSGQPAIGREVWIGPGALIYGAIRVGDGVTVLPNTVLSRSVPARCLVGGNPAGILKRDFDNSALRSSLATDVVVPQTTTH